MKAFKYIIKKQEIDLDIVRVTILSEEEYEHSKHVIQPIYEWWWLRSPGIIRRNAGCVLYNGSLLHTSVDRDSGCVRPALQVLNLQPLNLKISDKIDLAGYTWTVISENLILCDSPVGKTAFRNNWQADNANIYEASDLKKWVKKWAAEKGILITQKEKHNVLQDKKKGKNKNGKRKDFITLDYLLS